jgi:hypothetical protein
LYEINHKRGQKLEIWSYFFEEEENKKQDVIALSFDSIQLERRELGGTLECFRLE